MKRIILAPVVLALVAAPVLAGTLGDSVTTSDRGGGTISGNAGCDGRCDSVVVYLEGGQPRGGDGESVPFDQKDKVFVPHVLPILKGTTVRVLNSDPFLHNVHAYQGKKTFFNLALPFQGMAIDQVFTEPGVYTILCDAHPEMSAFVVVLENALFAAPNGDGSYTIDGVAPASYTLVRYDAEKDKTVRKAVTVGTSEVTVDF